MKAARIAAAAFVCFSATALAQKEGLARLKFSTHMADGAKSLGEYRLFWSPAAARTEMEMDLSGVGSRSAEKGRSAMPRTKMVMLMKLSDPDHLYTVNDERKTYSVMDLKKIRESPGTQRPEETWTVKRLGGDTVAGVACQKALLISSKGDENEVCVATGLLTSSPWWAMWNGQRHNSNTLFKALQDAGLKGFPVRMVHRSKGNRGETTTVELVSLERKSVPSSLFQIPAGYRQVSAGLAGMTAEQEKQLNDALSKMTPEQRKQYEEFMKQHQKDQ